MDPVTAETMKRARDGSEKKIGKGYWTLRVVGAELETVKIIPVYEWRRGAILAGCTGFPK